MSRKVFYIPILALIGLTALSLLYITYKKNIGHADLISSSVEAQPPINLRGEPTWVAAAGAGSNIITWDASPDAVTYNVYQDYTQIGTSITATTWQIPPDKLNGSTYTVTAVENSGQESIPSNIYLSHGAQNPNDTTRYTGTIPSPKQLSVTAEWNLGKPRMKVAWLDGCCDEPYNIYRDGQVIAKGLRIFTYYDRNVLPGESHTYYATTDHLYSAGNSESAPSNSITAIALQSIPAELSQKVTVTGVQRNDDSVSVYFDPIPGVADYRIYKTSTPHTLKYAGRRDYRSTDFACGKTLADCGLTPIPYSIELNNVDITNGNDVIVEAVDKLGPFQTMDGPTDPTPGSMLADGMHMSTNGQGDPSDVPNVLAKSDIFHITTKPRSLTGGQVFFDTFKNEQPLVQIPDNTVDPAIMQEQGNPDTNPSLFNNHGVREFDNNKWAIRSYEADRKDTKVFFMNNHFMDTLYDGFDTTHNNNASVVMMPKATADISGGKVLHWTEEIDAHADGRRFFDTIITQAGQSLLRADPSKVALSPDHPVTAEAHELVWSINTENNNVVQFNGKDVNGKVIQKDVANTAFPANSINSGGERLSLHQIPLLNGSNQDLDKRHIFDMYLSQTHIIIFENGEKVFDADLNQPLPFSNIQLYAAHELYHTYNDRNEQIASGYSAGYNVYGGYTTYDHNLGDYWIDHRPYSDERHWDNMGFEVVNSMSQAQATTLAIEAPQFIGSPTPTPSSTPSPSPSQTPIPTPSPTHLFTPTPTSTPTPTPIPTVSLDLNGDGKISILDIILSVKAFNGAPNPAALLVWSPSGNPNITGIIQLIKLFNDANK